jgi:hypothetical protein
VGLEIRESRQALTSCAKSGRIRLVASAPLRPHSNLSDARQTPMRPKAAHSLGSCADRGANSPSDCEQGPSSPSPTLQWVDVYSPPPNNADPVLEESFARIGNSSELVPERMMSAMKLPGADLSSRSNGVSPAT